MKKYVVSFIFDTCNVLISFLSFKKLRLKIRLQADNIRLHWDDKWIGVDMLVTSNLKPVLKYPYYDHASDSYKSIFEKKSDTLRLILVTETRKEYLTAALLISCT